MTMPGFEWHQPVRVHFGAGCSERLFEQLGTRPVVVLALQPAQRMGLLARWQARLGPLLLRWVAVPEGLPSLALAQPLAAPVWEALARRPDAVLLAVGGGSVLDLAKLLRCRPADGNFGHLRQALRGSAPWPPQPHAALWLVPTTAGTGSEMTRWATVWDTDATPPQKRSLDEPWGYAEQAFVDPTLALSCPPEVTRDTALDTLAHALEALWNHQANPVSDRLAVQAARRVLQHLPQVLQQPLHSAGREQLALAALEAGMAFSQTRTALAHALSYALTLQQGVPHGLACAAWLPTAWALALGCSRTVDDNLAQVFDVPAAQGVQRLRSWLEHLGVQEAPQAFALQDAPQRVQQALGSVRGQNFIAAPRAVLKAAP